MAEQPQRGILGEFPPTPRNRVIDKNESADARAIREFREAQASYGHRVWTPDHWSFH
jgi:hypothetical protein